MQKCATEFIKCHAEANLSRLSVRFCNSNCLHCSGLQLCIPRKRAQAEEQSEEHGKLPERSCCDWREISIRCRFKAKLKTLAPGPVQSLIVSPSLSTSPSLCLSLSLSVRLLLGAQIEMNKIKTLAACHKHLYWSFVNCGPASAPSGGGCWNNENNHKKKWNKIKRGGVCKEANIVIVISRATCAAWDSTGRSGAS